VQSRNDNEGEKLSSKHNRRQQQQEQPGSGVKKGVSTVSETDETARLQIQWPPPGFVNSEQQFSFPTHLHQLQNSWFPWDRKRFVLRLLANLSTFIAESFPSKMLCLADCLL
jgi:hypothetical protein